MDRLWIFIAGGIFGAIGTLLFYHRKADTPNDCEEDNSQKIQSLIDKVDVIIADIKNTV